ncbi:hypothetical protein [Methylocystis sp. S23]
MEPSYPYRFGRMLARHEDVADRIDRYLRNRPHIAGIDREMLAEISDDIRRVVASENNSIVDIRTLEKAS